MLLTRFVLFAYVLASAAASADAQAPSDRYLVRGVVRDSATGAPVAGAYVWPILQRRGAVADSAGRFEVSHPYTGTWMFLVRLCDDRNLAVLRVEFGDTTVLTREVNVVVPAQSCPPDWRPPWSVDAARDTTAFRGHYTYSWEGGGWLTSCDGRNFSIDWESPLGPALRGRRAHEGQRSFVRFRGRVTEDGFIGRPLFLAARVEEVRPPLATDCR